MDEVLYAGDRTSATFEHITYIRPQRRVCARRMRSRGRGDTANFGWRLRVTSPLGDPDPSRGSPAVIQWKAGLQKESRGMITRRDLLRSVAGTVGLLGWPSGHASGEPPPETTSAAHRAGARASAWPPSTSPRSSCEARDSRASRYVKIGRAGSEGPDLAGRGRLRHGVQSRRYLALDAQRPHRRSWRSPRRMFRAVRDRARPRGPRLEGQDRRDRARQIVDHVFLPAWRPTSASIREKDIAWATIPRRRANGSSRREGRRLHGLPPRSSGAARQKDRPRHRQQRDG